MISVVIPTLDEERALPRALDSVVRQSTDHELIVVDGGSRDGTLEIVERYPGEIRLLRRDQGRSIQLNAGAEAAIGEWLLFLHADTVLPENGLAIIDRQPESVAAGCFRHRFSGDAKMLRILTWFHNHRFRFTRVIYGDQGLFLRRSLFHELGGFPDRPMEDIVFSLTLRRATRPVMVDASVVTDSRKFDQMGHWRALVHAVWLLARFRFGSDVSKDPFFTDFR